tara:strand:- start:21012 stop:21599 length:588 start_codon:yes stop_codon:yes gene_type:complete
MSSFNVAWDSITKMPIVPGSVSEGVPDPRARYAKSGYKQYTASFEDPVTGEILPMLARHGPSDLQVTIKDPKEEVILSTLDLDSQSDNAYRITYDDQGNKNRMEDWEILPPYYSAGYVETQDDRQRRGYATALYDLAAYLLSRGHPNYEEQWGGQPPLSIVPSGDQEEDGFLFWENAYKTGKVTDDDTWRVRDDL